MILSFPFFLLYGETFLHVSDSRPKAEASLKSAPSTVVATYSVVV
jgi:hypothetical protein